MKRIFDLIFSIACTVGLASIVLDWVLHISTPWLFQAALGISVFAQAIRGLLMYRETKQRYLLLYPIGGLILVVVFIGITC